MKKRIRLFSLIVLLLLMLVVFTGCSKKEGNQIGQVEQPANGDSEVTNNVNSEQTTTTISEAEALDIGKKLYELGIKGPKCGDSNESFDYDTKQGFSVLATKIDDNKEVEENFSKKRISEIGEVNDPYGLLLKDGNWYTTTIGVGDDPTIIGHTLKINEISNSKISFEATTYYIEDMMILENYIANYENDYLNPYGDKFEEIRTNNKVTENYNEFAIIFEEGSWKIDTQEILY